jgi:hypothetical protein
MWNNTALDWIKRNLLVLLTSLHLEKIKLLTVFFLSVTTATKRTYFPFFKNSFTCYYNKIVRLNSFSNN